jgi:antitoxin ParD1/3/4
MNISLPAPLKEWVDQQIARGGFGTASEYIRQLLREEQLRQARLAVEAKLEEAEASGKPEPVTAKTWEESEQRVAERLKAARKRKPHGENR